ncbi:MAG: Sua5 family C-terminal domain-containing protein, partial [Bradymonadaceae bacterium]
CGDTTSAAGEAARVRELPCRVEAYARDLYDALHDLDRHCDRIVVEPPPREPRWRAVWNRLRRAAR